MQVSNTINKVALWIGTGLTGLALTASSWAQKVGDMPGGPKVNQLNLTEGVTGVTRDQHWIHLFLLAICLAIFIAVFAVMFYSVWAHRKSKGAKPANFHHSTTVEIIWTIVPFIIVVILGIPATRMVIEQKDTSNSDITIKATGYQWKWGYDYLKGDGEGISFYSTLTTPRDQIENYNGNKGAAKTATYLNEVDNELVVPVNKKIRIITTANDVIHAWMVPAFGVKQDAIPGFVRDTWFRAEQTGTFHGNCAELCGKDHAFMPIVVTVKSEADYKAWVDGKKKEMAAKADDPNKEWAVADLSARGEKIYAANCVACHQATGAGVPGAFPALVGSKAVLGPKPDQINILLNGQGGGKMPAWKQLSDTDIAAVITYTRNAWGNKAEQGLIQPKEVAAARK